MSTLESFSKKSILHGIVWDYPSAIVRHDHAERAWPSLQACGLPCWWYCAYVGLEKSHSYYGRPFLDPPVSSLLVHGGLSFSDWRQPHSPLKGPSLGSENSTSG